MLDVKFKGNDKARAFAMLSNAELDKDKQYHLTLKEVKKKRSLNANALAWKLMDKLSERIHESSVDIYKGYIKNIGGVGEFYQMIPGAVKSFRRYWSNLGIGWQTDIVDEGEEYTTVIAYKGSSEFDTAQMSRLIDLIIQDCKSLGIETLDDIKIKYLIDEWGEKS